MTERCPMRSEKTPEVISQKSNEENIPKKGMVNCFKWDEGWALTISFDNMKTAEDIDLGCFGRMLKGCVCVCVCARARLPVCLVIDNSLKTHGL